MFLREKELFSLSAYHSFYAMDTLTEYTERWPCAFFDILLNKYFPAG